MADYDKIAKQFLGSKLITGLVFDSKDYIVEDGLVYFKNIQLNYMFHAYLQGLTDGI